MMSMPITVEIVDVDASPQLISQVFDYFTYVDNKFSVYKETSEITQINQGLLKVADSSPDMQTVFRLADQTKMQTNGFFDINHQGIIDPSGLVKGWAIFNAAQILISAGIKNCYVEAGGDIQVYGQNSKSQLWTVGIRNPFKPAEIVKVVQLRDQGIATSGTYLRGQHIYIPSSPGKIITEVISLSVIGPDIYEADRFATAAFAMGLKGVEFIENLPGFEAYQIDKDGKALFTSGFSNYVQNN